MSVKFQMRMSESEKERLDELSSITGSKNNSDFIRKYINDLYDFIHPVTKGISEIDYLLKKLKEEKENAEDPWQSYSIQSKISLLEEMKSKL